jgi:GNAT superfamily N-acetyltransferase
MRIEAYSTGRAQEALRLLNLTRPSPLDLASFLARDDRWPAGDFRRRWLGLDGGSAVTVGQLAFSPYAPEDHVSVLVAVDPARRLLGLGSRMLGFLQREAVHLGYSGLTATVPECAPGQRSWLEVRGFRRHALRRDSLLYLETSCPEGRLPEGLTLSDMGGAAESRWKETAETMRNLVADAPDMTGVPRWSLARCLTILREAPNSRPEWVIVGAADGRVVGLTVGQASGSEMYSLFTGVTPGWRGRGVGRALKLRLISRARDAGIVVMRTTNLEGNAPARSLNASLGFCPVSATVELRRLLAQPQPPARPEPLRIR